MKTTSKTLEVDFIGGQEPLTIEEEKSLSEYFKSEKKDTMELAKKTVQNKKQIRVES
jgi:hypothetical protein